VETYGGSRTTVTVHGKKFKKKIVIRVFHSFLSILSGDPFVAEYIAHNDWVDENKRQCATIFPNHLIAMGVMILDGQRGNNFQAYVESLNAASWGYFTVHTGTTLPS
jgi:hypothetical protein